MGIAIMEKKISRYKRRALESHEQAIPKKKKK